VWVLVLILVVSAFIGRGSLDTETWVPLTLANALALILAVNSLRKVRLPLVMHAGILAVFLIGGLFQLYLVSYHVSRSSDFVLEQAPLLSSAG
jgi:hypothetical protein